MGPEPTPALALEPAGSARLPLAVDGAQRRPLRAAARSVLQVWRAPRSVREEAAPRSDRAWPGRAVEREPPGLVLGPQAPDRCGAAEKQVKLALELGQRQRVAAMREPFSPAPFLFPAPAAAWQVPPASSGELAALRRPAEEALLDVLVSPQVARAVVLRQAAVALPAARLAAEVRLQAVPDALAELPLVLPWEAASAFHRDPAPPWPAPRRAARSAHEMWQTQTAGPLELW
jgi:hypothetical protein